MQNAIKSIAANARQQSCALHGTMERTGPFCFSSAITSVRGTGREHRGRLSDSREIGSSISTSRSVEARTTLLMKLGAIRKEYGNGSLTMVFQRVREGTIKNGSLKMEALSEDITIHKNSVKRNGNVGLPTAMFHTSRMVSTGLNLLEQSIQAGKADSHQSDKHSTPPRNGPLASRQSGNATMQHASGASWTRGPFLEERSNFTFITSIAFPSGRGEPSSIISSCSATDVTSGFTVCETRLDYF